jgi:hemerythrin superfamily protein
MDAIELLKQDHRRVEQLFSDFLENESETTQEDLFQQIETELLAHGEAEEQVFYPALREHAADKVEEALKEHGRVKQLLADLLDEDVNEEDFESKFTQLMEDVQHHVSEEEGPGGVMEIARELLGQEELSDMAAQIEAIKRDVEDELAA